MADNLKPTRSDNRGGKRENAGRKSLGNVPYYRKMNPAFVAKMDEYLNQLKNENSNHGAPPEQTGKRL